MTSTRSLSRRLCPLLAVALLVVACGTEAPRRAADTSPADPPADPPGSTPAVLPDGVPAAVGEVTTRYPVTVLDDGDGAELCLGGVMESLPPQCGGPSVVGWDWHEHEGDYEQSGGTRWGSFMVTGLFDGSAVTPSDVVPEDEHDAVPSLEDVPATSSCAEPEGGWVTDPDRVDHADLDAAFRVARRLGDYAGAFVDTSRDSRSLEQQDQDAAAGEDDVPSWVVNVTVTQDPVAAAGEIRRVWGGGLCVATAAYTERELRRIQREVMAVPGFLGNESGDDTVGVAVVHDDGSIQAWADDRYGEGVVVVTSALTSPTLT